MNKRITYLNPNIKNYTDYNIIIEDDKNQCFLTKYDDNLKKLLNQEILVENIYKEKEKINNEIDTNNRNIKYMKKDIITTTSCTILFPLFINVLFELLLGSDFTFYIRRIGYEVVYSTFFSSIIATITIPSGLKSLILNTNKLKKEKNIHTILELQSKHINEILENETTKQEELKRKANLEKNSIKLETKNINANEEINRIINDLQSIYQENCNNNEKTSKKHLIKNL